MMKNILDAPFIEEMVRMTSNMYAHGWDERNGGNISLLLDEKTVSEYLDTECVVKDIPTGFETDMLGDLGDQASEKLRIPVKTTR